MPLSSAVASSSVQPSGAVRWFGHLQLLRLLGRSQRTMAWRVADARSGQELMLVLPRVQPATGQALQRWLDSAHQAARLQHPRLAKALEVGVHEGWPFVTYGLQDEATLNERVGSKGLPGTEAAHLITQLLQALAFAHEAGVAHHDLQAHLVLLDDGGQVRLTGLAVAVEMASDDAVAGSEGMDPATLRRHRQAAERDVLCAGVLLHGMLCGQSALDEPDTGRLIQRLPPLGREVVRLPWTTVHTLSEPLRTIVNRSTDRQERQRYRSARTLLRALEGWLQTDAESGGGPMALLADRLRINGALPSSPGASARAARLALMEGQRTIELAQVVLQDLALSFELLRLVNSAQVRGAQLTGSGPVLTVRRAIAMLGMDGVRRAALALRDWPGPLADAGAQTLHELMARCQRAGRVAMALQPAGYDTEVVYLLTVLQSLGRLVVQYHFPEEAVQIRRLMLAAPSPREGEPEDPGMSEEAAAFAVLGADIDAVGAAVARHWGLDESVLAMARRLPLAVPVRTPESDDETLRAVASCANEAVDATALPTARINIALQRVIHRYGRILDIGPRELQAAMQLPARPIAQETDHGQLATGFRGSK